MNTKKSKTENKRKITKLLAQSLKGCYFVNNHTALSLALSILFASCTNTSKENNNLHEINIIENLSNTKAVKLSTIASGIEYVVLETNENCLIPERVTFYSSKDEVVAIGFRECYIFDRKTGGFVRQIGSMGQGPGEYLFTNSRFWDAENKQVCFFANEYLFYNIDGTFSHQTSSFEPYISFIQYEDLYIGYVSNSDAKATIRIAFFDKKGVLVDSIPNYRSWKRTVEGFGGSGGPDN